MNIFDIAKHMEREGEKYYRELAAQSEDAGIKNIFNSLADDEVRHYQLFDEMGRGDLPNFGGGRIIEEVREILQRMREGSSGLPVTASQQEIYRIALENEHHSIDAYLQFYEKTGDIQQRQLLQQVIEEERKHVVVLENLIDYIRRPQVWLEDAEFNNLSEY